MLRPGFLRNLDEDTSGRTRMNERYQVSTGADFRRFIDQARAGGLEPRERRVNVVDAVTDVMDPGASLCEELPDGSLGTGRLEQFDARCTNRKHAHIDALFGDGLAA